MKLFYDDEFDALAQTISNSNKAVKQCAAFLFPHLKPESQYARLKACLNPEKDERLTLGQIIALCKFCQSYDALYFMATELNHSKPELMKAEDELAALLREHNELMQRVLNLAPRIETAKLRIA